MKSRMDMFNDMHIPVTESGCWLWIGGRSSSGYGSMPSGRKIGNEGAHRFSYRHHKGEIPAGMFVCHKCDTKTCVNPAHLFLGTHQENMDDCKAKGRTPAGERHGRSKLTEAQVIAIRSDIRGIAQVAAEYGVSIASIHNIRHRKTWACLSNKETN